MSHNWHLFPNSEERLVAFRAARLRLRAEYGARGAAKKLIPYLSQATLNRLLAEEGKHPDRKFDAATQERLILYFKSSDKLSLYEALAQQIGQSEIEKQLILAKFEGDYTYFRFASHETIKEARLVQGKIRIFSDNDGNPAFLHWSHDWKREGEEGYSGPEHNGYVFYVSNRLYMAGRTVGIFRLAIGRAENADDFIPGLVLSVRAKEHKDPYSARFVMISDKLHENISDLENGGPKKFFEITKGNYAYYMLIH